MKSITIDRNKPLKEESHTGHNRWHPCIEPKIEVLEGEEVLLETRDALDGQFQPNSKDSDILEVDAGRVHPLTGPVYISGAKPGDLLEVEFLDVIPQPYAFSAIMPGLGFLRDIFLDPFLVHWSISQGWAHSDQIPGVRIPGASFMGVSGVAPSPSELTNWTIREQELIDRGGMCVPPNPQGAVPANQDIANTGLSTLPPRESGGNFDVKQLTKGSKLFLPVSVDGALFSTGDGHFAQGDGEVCVTAIEMGASCVVRFNLHKDRARSKNIRWPRFSRNDYFVDPKWGVPQNFIATMGMPITSDGFNDGENLTLACRNALINMIELLQDRGWTKDQAYVICSVAVDLKISNVVDVPNYVVSAILPEGIFID